MTTTTTSSNDGKRVRAWRTAIMFCMAILTGTLTAAAQPGHAPAPAQNAIYAEALGNGLFVSLNYERFIDPATAIRFGGFLASEGNGNIIAMYNRLIGDGSSRLELGGGLTYLRWGTETVGGNGMDVPGDFLLVSGTIGYRYQPVDGGLVVRAGFTPIVNPGFNNASGRTELLLWGGASVGWSW